jgi:hypothetical protein
MAVQSCRLCTGQNGPAERNASSVFGLEMSLSRIISSAKVPAGYQRTHRLVLDQPWGLGTDGNGAEVAGLSSTQTQCSLVYPVEMCA